MPSKRGKGSSSINPGFAIKENMLLIVTFVTRLLKISKRKDYYKILGVAKDANQDAIKKGYRKAALRHHPGRVLQKSMPPDFIDFLRLSGLNAENP